MRWKLTPGQKQWGYTGTIFWQARVVELVCVCVCVARVFFFGTASGVCETEKRGGILQSFYLLQLSHWLGHIVSRSNNFFYLFMHLFCSVSAIKFKLVCKVSQHDILARAVLLCTFLDTGEGRSANARDGKKTTRHVKAHTDDLTPKYRTGAPFM